MGDISLDDDSLLGRTWGQCYILKKFSPKNRKNGDFDSNCSYLGEKNDSNIGYLEKRPFSHHLVKTAENNDH
jgi:hypothetical protein